MPSSRRKPVPAFIPSPPSSPSAGRQEELDGGRPEVCDARLDLSVKIQLNCPPQCRWQDATQSPLVTACRGDDISADARHLPRIGSPVYLGSSLGMSQAGQLRIYRPPTPPRPGGPKTPRMGSPDASREHVEFPRRRPDGLYAWSLGTEESCSRHTSLLVHTPDWQLADLPNASNQGGRIRTLSSVMRNIVRACKRCGALCV
ncbi:hypothetical protein FB45DRAFT_415561 [Roridomyces roridus]|uniref:Uncharacterized protein n=1 Tax=Roridomyces roridus TaxID=1738132 RepID=A0AAD7FUQ0_9AGAR|nr:hypothetical protein FB45DRAFT_415561 [Roridomyces roridus]